MVNHAERVFEHLQRALDLSVQADDLRGLCEPNPLAGPCDLWAKAAREIWEAWQAACDARDSAYDLSNEARGEDDG